jgi:hypothetical protein
MLGGSSIITSNVKILAWSARYTQVRCRLYLARPLTSAILHDGEDSTKRDPTRVGIPDPLSNAVHLVEAGEAKSIRFSPDHNYFSRKFRKESLSVLFGLFTDTRRERHRGADLTFFAHCAFKMYSGAAIRKLKFDWERAEFVVAGVGSVSIVIVRLRNLT